MPTINNSAKFILALVAQSKGTQTQNTGNSIGDPTTEAIKVKDLISMWNIRILMFRLMYRHTLKIFITLLAVCYVAEMKPYLSDIGYPRALLELNPELPHESYERKLDVQYILKKFDHLTSRYMHREVHVVICGGPGSGKSELVRQLGQQVYTKDNGIWLYWFDTYFRKLFNLSLLPPPVDVITLNAGSLSELQHSIEYVIGKFEGKSAGEITYNKYTGEKQVVAAFLLLKQTLERRSSKPLIIFDNVNEVMFDVLYKNRIYGRFLLNPGNVEYGKIRVVVTTQHRPIIELKYTHYMNLFYGMSPNDSVKLLNAITKIYNDDKHAKDLAEYLGGFPFSLANAALYIKSTKSLHEKEPYYHYIKEFEVDLKVHSSYINSLWEDVHDRPKGLFYNRSIITSMKMIKQLVNTSNGNVYKNLACFVGFSDMQTTSAHVFFQYIKVNLAFKNYTEHNVTALVYSSLIYDLQARPGHTFILTHQVAREASRIVCKLQGNGFVEDSLERILTVISEVVDDKPEDLLNQMTVYTPINLKLVDVLMSMVSHSFRLKLNYAKMFTNEFCWKFLNFMAEPYLYWPNKHKSKIITPNVTFLINMINNSFVEGKLECGAIFSVLYVYYTGNRQHEGLEKVVKLVSDFATSSFKNVEKNSVLNIIVLLNMMGTLYRDFEQKMSKAQELHELALNISQIFGSRPEIAVSLHLLGIVHKYKNQLDQAQRYHEQAVHLAKQIYRNNSSRLGAFLLNLAVVYTKQGELNKANITYQQALFITKEASHDQRVARVLKTLAKNHYYLGQYDDSIHALLEALSIHEKNNGNMHPNVCEILHLLYFPYRAKGDLQQLLAIQERSHKIREQFYGPTQDLHNRSTNTQREMHNVEDPSSNVNIFPGCHGKKSSEDYIR